VYDDELIRPYYEHSVGVLDVSLFDIHTHTGSNDPDGFRCSADTLTRELTAVGSRAVVMPMHEPAGYPPANDRVLAEAESSGGVLVAFCRLDPHKQPLVEALRCVEAGARGLKLHPRSEGFELSEPAVAEIFAFAHERRLPVLIHAGRGIPALARDALRYAREYPDARIILGHAGICDLNWIWREVPSHPNLFFDLSWWHPADLITLIALVPPGQLLYASDLPYFTPMLIATFIARYGGNVGLTPPQLAGILGQQAERLLAAEELLDLGPAPGSDLLTYVVRLERVKEWLIFGISRMLMGDSGYEPLAVARLACDIGDDEGPVAEVCRNVVWLLERQERFAHDNPTDGAPEFPGVRSMMLAACLARTPGVGLPRIPELEPEQELRKHTSLGHRVIDLTALPTQVDVQRDLRRSSATDLLAIDPSVVRRPSDSGAHELSDLLPPGHRPKKED
jgi:predicted TIM-barrel fold metal-dependent hydrolase